MYELDTTTKKDNIKGRKQFLNNLLVKLKCLAYKNMISVSHGIENLETLQP